MDHILMKVLELQLYVQDLPNGREKAIIMTKLDEIRHWATDLQAKNPKVGLMEMIEKLEPVAPPR